MANGWSSKEFYKKIIFINKKERLHMKNKVLKLLEDIKEINGRNQADCKLPGNVYFLNDSDILCLEREEGESRYPYDMDGMNLWVHSSGYINASESMLRIFKKPINDTETNLEFWGGIQYKDGWFPISITGSTSHMYEPLEVKHYLVYSKREAYFIADTEDVTFALRACVSSRKEIIFSSCAINKKNMPYKLYIASFISPHLRFSNGDDDWYMARRKGIIYDNGSFTLMREPSPGEDVPTTIAVINKNIECDSEYTIDSTVSSKEFYGIDGNRLFNAYALKNGGFKNKASKVYKSPYAIVSDILTTSANPNSEIVLNYSLKITHNEDDIQNLISQKISSEIIDEDIKQQSDSLDKRLSGFDVKFGEFKNVKITNNLFNKYLRCVMRQVDLCALGKNYVSDFLGFRDVFQQLTSATIWNKDDVRKQIVRCLNYLMINGRAPRQFSFPPTENDVARFDIRQYIDQGLWVIETLHKYLSRTGDWSILDEQCSYYEIIDEKKALYKKSDVTDSVLVHILRITDFLISKIDDRTGCLRILFGDWNDSVNGLGKTKDPDKEFGTGVSVMATLQLYKLLDEMSEILSKVGGYEAKVKELSKIRESIACGLEKYAIQSSEEGRHILHGWGDKGSYNVGSLCDTDGQKRYSVNSYSFWVISKMIERDPSIKEDIMKAYSMLDSKFGLKTFDKAFTPDMLSEVGHIAKIPPGMAENACTYVHATTFAIMALFAMGEAKMAWEQIIKIIPIANEKIIKSPFTTTNCYQYNKEFGKDGTSGSDWYTGSGAVLMRCIYEGALGIQAGIKGITIATPDYLPADNVSAELTLKGKKVKFTYNNQNSGCRRFYINGTEIPSETDKLSGYNTIFIKNEDVIDNMVIEVVD